MNEIQNLPSYLPPGCWIKSTMEDQHLGTDEIRLGARNNQRSLINPIRQDVATQKIELSEAPLTIHMQSISEGNLNS